MAVLSAGNLVSLRTGEQAASLGLSILQPVTLLTAQVNNALITRGARSVAYDTGTGTGFSTIEAGQLAEIDTADGTKYVRVKSISGSQSTGTIVLSENSIDFADNNAIRIKHCYPLFAIPPTIRGGIFYKDYDVAYSTQNSTPNPVALAGAHRVGTLSGGSVAFSLSASNSYAIASGATISSYLWSCVHNGGSTSGIGFSSTTSATPTLTITEVGQYWLKLTVTDSNAKTQSTYRAIWVYDSSTVPYKDFTISGLSGDWNTGGWRFNLEATGTLNLATFPDHTLVVVSFDNTFDGTAGYVDIWGTASQNILCAGYLRSDQDNDNLDNGTGRASFEVTTPDGVLDAMTELGSISINAVASPATWYQYASWLTVGRGIHHLLKWHSTVLETCDVYNLTGNTLGVKNIDFTEPSVLQMINGLAYSRGIFHKMVSNRMGQLRLDVDSQMLNDAGRAALDTVFTIAVSDVSGTVDVVRQPEERVATSDLDGFSFNGTTGTPFISIAPGYRESSVSFGFPEFRGVGNISTKGQVLSSQTDSNEKAGRVLAAANNNPRELRFTMPSNYIGAFDILPAIGMYQWGISDSGLKRGTALNGKKFICRHVDVNVNVQAGTLQTSVVLEKEALGADGIQGNYPTGYPPPALPAPPGTGGDGGGGAFTITYGYFAGGDVAGTAVATADRLLFSTETTAANSGSNLSDTRRQLAGVSSRSVYGYFLGGEDNGSTPVTTADRMTLSTGATAAHSAANLSAARRGLAGLTDAARVYGYVAGGEDGSSVAQVTADRITYSTSVTAANSGSNLSTARVHLAGFSDGATYGYFIGGMTDSLSDTSRVVTADRLTFSTGVTAAHSAANLSLARYGCRAFSSTTNGYIITGGTTGSTNATTIDRTVFATSITASIVATLSTPRRYYGVASNNTTNGYVAGGLNNTPTEIATTERMTFSTEGFASVAGANLSSARALMGSFSDGAF